VSDKPARTQKEYLANQESKLGVWRETGAQTKQPSEPSAEGAHPKEAQWKGSREAAEALGSQERMDTIAGKHNDVTRK